METPTGDPRALVAELRRRSAVARPRPWPPGPLPRVPERPPLASAESLRYLHEHWVLPERAGAGRQGAGWKRLVSTVAGRITFGALGEYLAAERELLSRVVQTCDALARRVDALEHELDALAKEATRQISDAAVQRFPGGDPGT